jgi:hypothetical protein
VPTCASTGGFSIAIICSPRRTSKSTQLNMTNYHGDVVGGIYSELQSLPSLGWCCCDEVAAHCESQSHLSIHAVLLCDLVGIYSGFVNCRLSTAPRSMFMTCSPIIMCLPSLESKLTIAKTYYVHLPVHFCCNGTAPGAGIPRICQVLCKPAASCNPQTGMKCGSIS